MTSARERFAREVAAGKSQADAYREAFPRSRYWKPETLHKRASELAATGEVLGRIEQLRRAADAEAIMDCNRARVILSAKVERIVAEDGPTIELCRAIDALARLSGWLTPAALAVAVAPVVELSEEERMRKFRETMGWPAEGFTA